MDGGAGARSAWAEVGARRIVPDAADGRSPRCSEETDERGDTVQGPEHGEALKDRCGSDGSVERLVWAGIGTASGPVAAPEQ